MKNLRRSQLHLALALLASAMSLANGSPLSAEIVATTGNFTFKIDQNLIALDNYANISNLEAAIADGEDGLEGSLAVAQASNPGMAAMWMPYTSILAMRKTPGMFLSNSTDSHLNIVGMELLLGDNTKQFLQFDSGEYFEESYASGEYNYVDLNTYNYWRVDPDLVPASAVVQDNGTRLVMSFGNCGILPGRATTFKVQTSTGMQLYEFFDESTEIDITFKDPVTNEIYSTGPQLLKDIDDFNDDLLGQVMEGTKNGRHFSEMVDPYWLGGSIIPEPTSMVLAVCGLSCLVLRRRRVTQSH